MTNDLESPLICNDREPGSDRIVRDRDGVLHPVWPNWLVDILRDGVRLQGWDASRCQVGDIVDVLRSGLVGVVVV